MELITTRSNALRRYLLSLGPKYLPHHPGKVPGCCYVLSPTWKETAHRKLATQKKLAYLGFQYLDQPPYSPDLTLSYYHLFPGLKKQLKGK
jgi:hypothetical protein